MKRLSAKTSNILSNPYFLGKSGEKSPWWRTQKHQSTYWRFVNYSCCPMELDFTGKITGTKGGAITRCDRRKRCWDWRSTIWIIFGTIFFTRNGMTSFWTIYRGLQMRRQIFVIPFWDPRESDQANKWLKDRFNKVRDFYKPFQNDQMVNVAVVMGLIYPGSKMGIREGLYNGGPLGEMIQWTDILTAMNSFENIKWDSKSKKNRLTFRLQLSSSTSMLVAVIFLENRKGNTFEILGQI